MRVGTLGYAASFEQFHPTDLLTYAKMAEENGFSSVMASDHFHPWVPSQGHSAFVWSWMGALGATTKLRFGTGVTPPGYRYHPAVLAQAAATSACLLGGRFALGVGSGEALNEHILGDAWPSADVRLEMLEEAVEVMRALWTGAFVNHRGQHYRVENARIYTLPDTPPPVYVSGFGPKSVALAARIGDGYVSTLADSDLLQQFRAKGGDGKPAQAGYKVCWGTDDRACIQIAHLYWANAGLPGELSQVLPSPRHLEQASALVTEDMTRAAIAYGADVDRHVEAFRPYADAGYDEIYVAQMGGRERETNADGFFAFYRNAVLPRLRTLA